MIKRFVEKLRGSAPDLGQAVLQAVAVPADSYENNAAALTKELDSFIRDLDGDLNRAFKTEIALHNYGDVSAKTIQMMRGETTPVRIDISSMSSPKGNGVQISIRGANIINGERETLDSASFGLKDISGIIGYVYDNIYSHLTCEELAYLDQHVGQIYEPIPSLKPHN